MLTLFKKRKKETPRAVNQLVIVKEENPDAPANVETVFHYRVSEESGMFVESDGFAKITLYSEKPIATDSEAYRTLHEEIIVSKFILDMLGYSIYGEEWRTKYQSDETFKEKVETYISYFIPISQDEYELGQS